MGACFYDMVHRVPYTFRRRGRNKGRLPDLCTSHRLAQYKHRRLDQCKDLPRDLCIAHRRTRYKHRRLALYTFRHPVRYIDLLPGRYIDFEAKCCRT